MKGEDSSPLIFVFTFANASWSQLKQPAGIIARDDHALIGLEDGSFFTFGGFVSGSRSNEVCHFNKDGGALSGTTVSEGAAVAARAGHSVVHSSDKLYVFGGTDDDNDKLGDLWCYDKAADAWSEIKSAEGEIRPVPRCGHSAVVHGDSMYIFGGILELTKELNDLAVFSFSTMKWE